MSCAEHSKLSKDGHRKRRLGFAVVIFIAASSALGSCGQSSDESGDTSSSDSELDSNSDGDADSDSGGDADSDTGGDADSDSDGDSDSDSDPPPPNDICSPDESGPIPDRPSYNTWTKVELPNTYCSNGSQYKFFVNYSATSNNLLIIFEPGGACWDYPSCSGAEGIKGAANPNGIQDTHMLKWNIAYPLFGSIGDPQSPARDWNKVFIPYCTGDIFAGYNKIATYTSDDGQNTIEYRHVGHDNMMEVIPWLDENFKDIPRLLIGGCSAGGVGALVNYLFLREGIKGVQCSYLLDDSGPIFSSDGPSAELHEKIRTSWNLDALILDMEDILGTELVEDLLADLGVINTALADRYPRDRLSTTYFRQDLNFSLYSYDRFFDYPPIDDIHAMWWEDTQSLIAQYDTRDNLAYFLPYFRSDNCSHCLSIVPVDHIANVLIGLVGGYFGTAIEDEDINMREYIIHLLDNETPLQSYLEDVQPDEGFTDEQEAACR